MQEQKRLQLSGVLQLVTNGLYEEEAMEWVKEELEALHGVKLEKTITEDYVIFHCPNFQVPHLCKYCVRFGIEFRMNRPNRFVLRLLTLSVQHRLHCRNEEQANFLKNKHALNQNSETIVRLIYKRHQSGQPIRSPTHVLQILCKQQKLDKNFMYNGLKDPQSRRKIKKRFDNIIAQARRRLKQFAIFTEEKTKYDDKPSERQEEDDEPDSSDSSDQGTRRKDVKEYTRTNEISVQMFRPLKRKIRKAAR